MAGNYKQAKEDFVSGMTGSSITHINLISLVALCSVSLYAALRTRIAPTRRTGFFASWLVLVFPMLLSMTLSANHPLYLSLAMAVPTLFILRIPQTERGTPLPSSQPSSPAVPPANFTPRDGMGWTNGKGKTHKLPPLPALTTYRAHMMLMTVLAILAVDFPVFPRSLAKCETFGVSLMDLGVGSFVFSQGIISAIPLVKDGAHLRSPFIPKLINVTRKSLPIILLGLMRVVLVKGTAYPVHVLPLSFVVLTIEHVTEYGVHWNFFLTLAVLPVLQVFLHPLFMYTPIAVVGVLVAIIQQIALSRFGLQDYVLNAPRTSLVSANKEGLVSLLGYLSIQLLGLSIGTLILPPTPSFYSRRQHYLLQHIPSKDASTRSINSTGDSSQSKKRGNSDPDPVDSDEEKERGTEFDLGAPRELDKTATELCAYAILWWTLLWFARLSGVDAGGVSRRMVNISYIFWVSAFNVSFLLSYIVVLDLWIFADKSASAPSTLKSKSNSRLRKQEDVSSPSTSSYFSLNVPNASLNHERHPPQTQSLSLTNPNPVENPPRLLDVVNQHGLTVFLFANVLTGLVNLGMSTMYASDGRAMLILSGYSILSCGLAWLMTPSRTR